MIGTRITVLAVIVTVLAGSAVFAADWNGLTVGTNYSLWISESGSGWGYIQQFDAGGTDIAVDGGVGYSLPSLTVTGAAINPFWGVCIDTHEWSTNPETATLKKGWTADGLPLGTPGRDNGTVLSQDAWDHTTYLFNQFQDKIGNMTPVQKAAFQLATWEVMSGDGSSSGGNWGAGKFTATNVTGTVAGTVKWEANKYVAAAYTGFGSWTGSQSLYFSGAFKSGGGNVAYQDYLVYAPAADPNLPIPEIPAMMLGPLGLVALGALRRKLAN